MNTINSTCTTITTAEHIAARLQAIRARSTMAGAGHGAAVGHYTREAVTKVADTTRIATTATTGYAQGFAQGFLAGWSR